MVYDVLLKRITKENFAEFGEYLDERSTMPTSAEANFDWWNEIGIIDLKGRISVGVVKPVFHQDFSETVFEQHSNTPEVLVPLDEDVVLLLGRKDAFATGNMSGDAFSAFLVPRGAVVSIRPGIWHHAPMVLNRSSRVIVLFSENTSLADNTLKNVGKDGNAVRVDIGPNDL